MVAVGKMSARLVGMAKFAILSSKFISETRSRIDLAATKSNLLLVPESGANWDKIDAAPPVNTAVVIPGSGCMEDRWSVVLTAFSIFSL